MVRELRRPPGWSSSAGLHPEGAANLGGLLFGYFLLAAQEKVTSRRAAPGHTTPALLRHPSSPRMGI